MSMLIKQEAQFTTKRELVEYLEEHPPAALLGNDVDSPEDYFVFKMQFSSENILTIGIISIGMGTNPIYLAKPECAFIVFNEKAAIVANDNKIIEFELFTYGAAIVECPAASHVIVIGESAVVAIAQREGILWRRDTDLITNWHVVGSNLHVTFSDDRPTIIDMISGANRKHEEAEPV